MLLKKELLAVFNRATKNTGRIYQADLGFLKSHLDEIVARGYIGGANISQNVFRGEGWDYEVKETESAGSLLSYEIINEPDGALLIYGDVVLANKAICLRTMFPEIMGFSINSVCIQNMIEGKMFMILEKLRGFDFVTVRAVPDQSSVILDSPTLKDNS